MLTKSAEIYIRIWLETEPSNKLYILGMVALLCYAAISDIFTAWYVKGFLILETLVAVF